MGLNSGYMHSFQWDGIIPWSSIATFCNTFHIVQAIAADFNIILIEKPKVFMMTWKCFYITYFLNKYYERSTKLSKDKDKELE